MDEETKQKIKETVIEILKGADMESSSEYMVRAAASESLGIDLSLPDRKLFVREVVETYLKSIPEEAEASTKAAEAEEEAEEEEEEKDEAKRRGEKEYDDEGDLIICRLSNKRRVTVQDFRGKTLLSIREYYEKNGKQMPSSKGISLTVDQWKAFRSSVPAIEDAIKKLEGSY